jgi:SAM-dependent methyltransferase
MIEGSFPLRVNVGCGASPTPGWLNFDNSLTVRIARTPIVGTIIAALPGTSQRTRFVTRARGADVRWATASQLPLETASMEVVYSSHMLEHLPRTQAADFLAEARRVLRPGGVLRLVVPDLRKLVLQYLESADADEFVARTLLAPRPTASVTSRLALAFLGTRDHAWMYDERSLVTGVQRAGFTDVRAIPAGETRVPGPEPLDLYERSDESLYVEGTR